MPVELNIVESVTELDTTVVEVNLVSASEPGPAGAGVPTGGTDGQVLTKTSATDYATAWEDPTGGSGGAPTDVDYLVGTASGDLSAEIVVGTAPGGELGGTWASPTVDATHSGSSHASVQAAAEATAAAALSAHASDTTGIHGISDTSALETTAGAQSKVDTHSADTTSVHGIADTSALALTANHPSNATFEDHSARHENGGADELSLAGLDGTPSALQTHLDDTSAAHAAAAISADSTTLVGTGTDVQAVLEELDNSIADHLADTADAHDASAISVLDTNGDYTATDVEGVLAEIAPQLGGSGGAGEELAYEERTTSLTVTGTNEGNAVEIVTADAVALDGSTAIWVEFFTPNVTLGSGGANCHIWLYDAVDGGAAASIGRVADMSDDGASNFAGTYKRRLTPASGSHVFSARASSTQGTDPVFTPGAGGAGATVPIYIRVTRA